MSGIWGGRDGAESVVVSGGYEDDKDTGDDIVYTGEGGNAEQGGGRQVADQKWQRGNAGLARNWSQGWPVRVVRGAHGASRFAPESGYRYDGLYRVHSYWEDTGKSGFRICRFHLRRDDPVAPPWASGHGSETSSAERRDGTIQRIVRNSALVAQVKAIHNYSCQVCGLRLETPGGPYAEGAHIRGLGEPHNGPDRKDNILCLCPNHHVLFDSGALTINDDLSFVNHDGALRTCAAHSIGAEYLAYHRTHAAKTN